MRSRRRSPVRKRVIIALLVFCLILGGVGVFKLAKYVSVLWQLSTTRDVHLKETPEKRINLLLLGVGGGRHDGPNLTDTIIFVSIDPPTKKVSLVSIPRDLWMPEVSAKINATYTFGEEKQTGGGLKLTKATVSKLLNQQVDYVFKIDFSGFEKAVDLIGGLDIDVANTFDDYAYPLSGKEDESCGNDEEKIASLSAEIASGSASELEAFPCRYEHLHFTSGKQHMDGTTALKYVRSRHAEGIEGSKRQEKVISAFKEKIFSVETLLNPVKVIGLVDTLKGSIETDIQTDEYDDFVRLAQKLKGASIKSTVLDTGEGDRLGLLTNPPISAEYANAWVLSPRVGNGDYTEIQEYVACFLAGKDCLITETGIATPTPTPTVAPSKKVH